MVGGIYWQVGTFVAGATLTALLLAVGHWYPWIERLPRVQAYVYGTVAIQLGISLWRGLNGDWLVVIGAWLITGVGGATVLWAYRVDARVRLVRQARKAEAVDGELGAVEK